MTTDITELAQREKFEAWAEEVGALPWGILKEHRNQDGSYPGPHYTYMWKAWQAASAELVEALEKAQAKATQQGNIACALFDEVTQLRRHADEKAPELRAQLIEADSELEALRQRIAELESRAVTVKQGEVLVTVAGFTGCGKSAIAGEIEIAMKAIGVPVTWANGDSEKRMTGADWLTAIEMYKPTVRIVEENIPRAAGIKIEAE
ncbi:ead/Ea22-like family protein [Klebsiella pasteurii]|uniref:ead/Ea22-like family protein n=1 Tax=Klebsiella pasteurii TaxID=2587529 RepID=UPI003AB32238